MSYSLLSKIYYKKDKNYNDFYLARFHGESTAILTGITIHDNPAFFVVNLDIVKLIEKIYKLINELQAIQLPPIAYDKLISVNLIDEIMLTNDIEGVYSSKKDIQEILGKKTVDDNLKFGRLVKKYQKLATDSIPLSSSMDIRAIYDEIVSNEIEKRDLPDGKIFRKESASVYSPTQKEKHVGINPEKKLISFLDQALQFLNNKDYPILIRISIFHYLFGYAHPFYDGNGRTSRFISSYLLSSEIGLLPSIRLACTINNHKSSYYKAFDTCNDKKNKGDLTPFLYMFLEIICDSLQSSCTQLENARVKLNYYDQILRKEITKLNEKESTENKIYKVLFILLQNTLFSDEGCTKRELAEALNLSQQTVVNYVKIVTSHNLPVQIIEKGAKKYYTLDIEAFENMDTSEKRPD